LALAWPNSEKDVAMDYPLRYLESFDSIRAQWQRGPNPSADEAHAQAYIETMVSLAFGNDIVIQQSFALDSLAFQNVLSDFKQAYDLVAEDRASNEFWANEKLPIRLHLYGSKNFREAAADIFRRIGDSRFHSHLYPELTGEQDAHAIADDLLSNGRTFRLMEWMGGDERAELFQDVWTWFGTSQAGNERQVVRPYPAAAQMGIGQLLAPVLSERSSLYRELASQDLLDHPTVSSILRAFRDLDDVSRGVDPFGSRSGLYSNSSWLAGGGPSPAEIVGAALPMVQEVVSTLYNRTTVDSMGGIASAYYSTAVSTAVSADDRLIAQKLALAAADHARGAGRPTRSPGSYVGGPSDPPMEIDIKSGSGGATLFDEQFGPRSRNSVHAFEGILRLRQDPKWQRGVREINAARLSGDFDGYVTAVNSHLDLVARGVGRHLIIRADSSGLSFKVEDPSQGGAVLSSILGLVSGFDLEAAEPAISLALDHLTPKVLIKAAQHASVKSSRRAWTEVVAAPRREH
jgi:hypothetical protein